MKTGLRLFALCATLLTSFTLKAQISVGWHYYTNEGAETKWGGVSCACGLSFQNNKDGVNTITVYAYTKGSDTPSIPSPTIFPPGTGGNKTRFIA